jgi:integrase
MSTTKTRKTNGAGHTYKVGNSWKTVHTRQGKIVATATHKNKQESKRLAKAKFDSLPLPNNGSLPGANKIKVSDYLIPWLENIHSLQISDTTLTRYLGLAKHYVIPALGEIQLGKVSKREITNLMTSMVLKQKGARTVNQTLALISAMFKSAVNNDIIENNPAKGIKKIEERSKRINPLTEDEVIRLLKCAKATFMESRLHIAFMGLRQGEALGLRWQDIDFDNKLINVSYQSQKVKGVRQLVKLKSATSHRKIMLSDATVDSLKRHKLILGRMRLLCGHNWIDNDLVFPNKNGGLQQPKLDYVRWKEALANAGISARSLHNARHTAGTLLYSKGEGIETIRRVLGHSSVSLTSRTYVHNADEPLREAAQTMNGIFSKTNHVA